MQPKYFAAAALLIAVACGAPGSDEGASQTNESISGVSGTYAFVSLANPASCMDVSASGTANGTQIQEWGCNGSGAQTFRLTQAANGTYTIVNVSSNKCVDINAAGTANGTKVQLWDCNGTGAQTFTARDGGNGNVIFVNPNSGRCLDISGSSPTDGTKVQLWDCNGTGAQTWTRRSEGTPIDAGTPPPPPPTDKCDATNPAQYGSAKTVWCVDPQVWAGHSNEVKAFFSYGDAVITELETIFNVTPTNLPFYVVARAPDGGAQTPTRYGPGVEVTGDAFYGDGFWGYLLVLHELVNQWTGLVSSGWPTDFWADHVSAFPNSMDWQIMSDLGTKLGSANLLSASARQKKRFYPGGDSVDPRVPMFDQIFALPNMGFAGWSRIFAVIQGDAMRWDNLGVANPDQKRSEYVAAYASLGARQSVLPILKQAHVCDGTADGAGDAGYVCSEANIDAIATAHCSIAAAGSPAADLQKLRSGNYAGVTSKGACGTRCPSECGCQTSTNRCVAPWLAN